MRFSLLASSRSSTVCSAPNNRPNRQDESERSAFLRGDHGFLAISRRRGRSGSACAPSSSREGTTVLTTAQAPATALATEPSSLTSACTASMPETFAGKQGKDRIGMPASDPGGEIGIMKRTTMRQVREVLRLRTARVGLNEIARRVGVAPSTVRLTLRRLAKCRVRVAIAGRDDRHRAGGSTVWMLLIASAPLLGTG
jgi:hypothetical protein